ncbi:MAG: porin [Candidatus Dadabacteria bacterium]|nr:porin [Candidatus Dadabacteria bacterium]MYC40695.1 porin [Candidatus Dadabacteria bacterium]
MYRFIKNGLMVCLLACASLVISLPAFAGGGGDVSEESMAEEAAPEEAMAEESAPEEAMVEEAPLIKDTDVSIYGRFWPRVTYENSDGSSTDITDALSRVGIKANTQITETLSAVLHGEWDVDIEQNGNFGDARQAYVGLRSEELGMLAIGKQWDPYFNIVAEVTDIFYHRASPFGYDQQGPFRSSNLVTYANNFGGLNVNAGMQVDGEVGNNAYYASDDSASNADNVDAASVGVGLSSGPVYIGVSYLRQNQDDNERERNYFGVGGSLNVNDNIYMAVTYQYIVDNYDNGDELNPFTLDVATSFSFTHGVTALAGFFMSDPDDGNELMGGNLTLIKEVHPALDVFAEWVLTDEDQGENVNTLSLGFRYDFDVAIF